VAAAFTGDSNDAKVVRSYALQFLSRLEPVFPGITQQWNGRATLDVPARNPYSRGSYSSFKTGQYTLLAGSERERSGNCHFAGEHCSIEFQGFMEGGVPGQPAKSWQTTNRGSTLRATNLAILR